MRCRVLGFRLSATWLTCCSSNGDVIGQANAVSYSALLNVSAKAGDFKRPCLHQKHVGAARKDTALRMPGPGHP